MDSSGSGTPKSVVFACDHNAVRSPIAEGIMKWLHGWHVFVQSAGIRSGTPLDGLAVTALDEIGVDISRHQPRTFDEMEAYGEDFGAFELIVSFTPAAHRRALEYTRLSALEAVYWPTEDPTIIEGSRETQLDAYRALRDRIHHRIEDRFGAGTAPGG